MNTICATIIACALSFTSLIAEEKIVHDLTCSSMIPPVSDEVANCFNPCQDYMLPNSFPSCEALPCFLFKPCFSYFYLGFEGGGMFRLSHIPKKPRVGGLSQGIAFDAKPHPGYSLGASVGYRWNCLLRTDLSYTFLHPASFRWKTFFVPPNPEPFKAHLHSHLFLFNTYAHLNEWLCFFSSLDPYITCGVGVALSRLDHIQEFSSSGTFYSKIQPYTQAQFAGRLGLGIMKHFCRCWILDLGFNANYIKSLRSGNERVVFAVPGISSAGRGKIGVYRFKNVWIGNFYLGLKYAF